MKYIILVLLCFTTSIVFGQDVIGKPQKKGDSLSLVKKTKPINPKDKLKNDSITLTIEDYKIISFERDTTFLDTTLTIQKEYKYNYLREDDFELMSFSNIGQAYNELGVDFERVGSYPNLGALAKDRKYLEKEQINYYNVATPMTELFFKTTLEEGQLLDANLTFNTSRRLNFSIGYIGFRSLGKYNDTQIESGNFITTTNYLSKNGRYSLRAHIAAQNISSEENGGLAEKEEQFESGDEDFINRPRVDVLLDDAENKILGKRYYLDHQYKLVRKQLDSTRFEKTALSIGHSFDYETKYYQFIETSNDTLFGDAILSAIDDKAILKTFNNEVNIEFYNKTLGRLTGGVNMYNYDYYFNSRLIEADGTVIPNRLNGTEFGLVGKYEKRIGGFDFNADLKYNLSGELAGNVFNASASYNINDNNKVRFALHNSTRLPNFNYLLYQSEYFNYNWDNSNVFEKERASSLKGELLSKTWGHLMVKYGNLDNYTYFAPVSEEVIADGLDNAFIKPLQEGNTVSHLKVKYQKEFRVGMFALNNTVMYQNVTQDSQVLNVPQLVTRNTLYFSSDVFKKAMFLQTGVTFKYFTAYNMNGYNPVLGEFYVQNKEELGGFPLLDFFINARIQQTRIYLKAEHFNASFSGYDYYAAPNYPYRDFVIRFGLVWNFFS
ncbi:MULTISPECIES: putative porin [unclassified Maribacter]|uniref:putative porin n=1 Tax=unclassified Maribacter TaxID=2615042 RepID=UPI00257A95F8|nr:MULTISPECIES: putative porin [unclassified Maribacter]|tara:strand:+ start:53894 stop:55885 length:1992 start_codon:yes stop_codon:yes gene_type:complete